MNFESRAQELLNRARVIAEASAAQIQVGRGHPQSSIPAMPGTPTVQVVADILEDKSLTREERIEAGAHQIRMVTHGPDREPETMEQRDWRIISDYEGRPTQFVADRERLSAERIRQIREAAGRDARTGTAGTAGTATEAA